MTSRKTAHLVELLKPAYPFAPSDVPPDVNKAIVSHLVMKSQHVGWGKPLHDQVLIEEGGAPFIQIDGQFFPFGLYAHAPARHILELKGSWKTLTSGYGLQEGHSGAVAFVVIGDGHELFRSPVVKDSKLREFKVDVSGVNQLELIVEPGGAGNKDAWGIWAEPTLLR